jgi:hypothetical protein
MQQTVYILTNEAMPGLVKIGFTEGSVQNRISNLSSATGVPLPYECYYAAEVDDMKRVESLLHQLFSEHRINPKREFFRLDPEKVVLALSIGRFKDVTPSELIADEEEKAALEKAKARRAPLSLEAIGVHPGAVLTFSRDENRTTTVAAGNKVILDGEMMSLSAAALKLLRDLGYKTPTAQGPAYWIFDGELLDERRRRLEAERFDEKIQS